MIINIIYIKFTALLSRTLINNTPSTTLAKPVRAGKPRIVANSNATNNGNDSFKVWLLNAKIALRIAV
ncbi:hypothetical protein [Methylicorpusculum sp.]|uniref:hypothetical protein n=1 Tax=Methylicorpusculum sp. TaxID=2713644 RepID=UPI002732C644|nr:hypothetical protein [Methylicorpusculum sp.]MDP3529311.1 hypothetical protein [Methylicorpusculum sp.]